MEGTHLHGTNNTLWKLKSVNQWSLIKTFENKISLPKTAAHSMGSHNGSVDVGLTGRGSSLCRMKDYIWEKVSTGLDEHPNDGIYEMLSHTDGNLYAFNISISNSTVVYKLEEKNLKWTAMGGKGINDSWINSSFTMGLSMSSHTKLLFVTMNRHPKIYGKFSSIWAYDDNHWCAIGNEEST